MIIAMLMLSITTCQPNIAGQEKSLQQYISQPVAYARIGTALGVQESMALAARQTITTPALTSFIGQPLPSTTPPSIAAVCSGGGYRAAIASLGLMQGLAAIGLLDAVTYWAPLSGSTWATTAWMTHNMALNDLTAYLKTQLSVFPGTQPLDKMAIVDNLRTKLTSLRLLSFNDFQGALLANIFLQPQSPPSATPDHSQTLCLSNLAPIIASGNYPIPIFSAVIGETAPRYQWMELSPFEVGSPYLSSWIPTTALGKTFTKGISYDSYPEEKLGFVLGLCGSAYAASINDIINAELLPELEASYNENLSSSWLAYLSAELPTYPLRFFPPQIRNFSKGLASSPLPTDDNVTLLDAGMSCDLPFHPMLRRNIPIYIVCDASDYCTDIPTNMMKVVQSYATANNYPLPPLDYQALTTQQVTICTDPTNPQAPLIIYIPNFFSFSTFKTTYTATEFDTVFNGIAQAVVTNAAQIKAAIQAKINAPTSNTWRTV